jgi:hypothetical protein
MANPDPVDFTPERRRRITAIEKNMVRGRQPLKRILQVENG